MNRTPKITTIINFCTNEEAFINHAIEQAAIFSDQVLVPVCLSRFSGEPEDPNRLSHIYQKNPTATFLAYEWNDRVNQKNPCPHFWHNFSRWLAIQEATGEFCLFLDADEVVDGHRFKEWLENTSLENIDSVKFENYWYFRTASYQAKQTEQSCVMTRRNKCKSRYVFTPSERHALEVGRSLQNMVDINGAPMIHHYSWVRTKEQMLAKVRSWGHKDDRNWEPLIENEFAEEFNGTDFVHGYSFNTIDPFVEIDLSVKQIDSPLDLPSTNVRFFSANDVQRLSISATKIGRLKLFFNFPA